jgi:glycerol-3-phosphate dehydrogenase
MSVTGEGVKHEYSIGRVSVEFAKGFIRDAHMRNVIAVLGGKWTNLAERSVAQVIAIAPRTGDGWRSAQRRLKSLRDEGRGK